MPIALPEVRASTAEVRAVQSDVLLYRCGQTTFGVPPTAGLKTRSVESTDTYADTFAAYLRCAACLDTPSITPISDHDRLARRAA